ncbi:MAG: MazG family protein [Actinomycetes bacterium]
MPNKNPPTKTGVAGLIELMDILRSVDGCPWDLEQTHETLIEYLIEEAYEFAEAVEENNREAIKEELGDVLLQVVFHSKIGQEHKTDPFNIDDVAEIIKNKLIKRHPHVFESDSKITSNDVKDNWEVIKKKEKNRTSVTEGLPKALPALMHAEKLINRVENFDKDLKQVEIIDSVKLVEHEIADEEKVGQFLLSFVGKCHEKGIDSETSLRKAITSYRKELES